VNCTAVNSAAMNSAAANSAAPSHMAVNRTAVESSARCLVTVSVGSPKSIAPEPNAIAWNAWHPHRVSMRCFCLMLAALVGGAGCGAGDISVQYGLQSGSQGRTSVNGTAVLASLFRQAGHQVTAVKRVSPRLRQFDVIIWFPDDFSPPDPHQRVALETWLADKPQRTLIYVGRDFDAAPHYWQAIATEVPPEFRAEVFARQAASQAAHDRQRVETLRQEFARWFVLDSTQGPRRLTSVSSDQGWADDLVQGKLDLHLDTRLLPPSPGMRADRTATAPFGLLPSETSPDVDGPAEEGGSLVVESEGARIILEASDDDEADLFDFFEFLDLEQAERQRTAPDVVEPWLTADDEVLVTRLQDSSWGDSQLFVVTNGSFLLNYALLNHEHRKLAGRLIEECGESRRVAFLETTYWNRVLGDESDVDGARTGLEVFTTWPLGLIVMQAMLVGLVLCFVLFPIFGPPRKQTTEGLSDFGQHVDALGRLLEQTRDTEYARNIVRAHHQALPPVISPVNSPDSQITSIGRKTHDE
jgi:hypothetical protein